MKKMWLIVALAVVATPAAAQNQARGDSTSVARGGASQQSMPTQQSDEARTCRTIDSTGTRMPRQRVCMTAREWRQYDRNAAN